MKKHQLLPLLGVAIVIVATHFSVLEVRAGLFQDYACGQGSLWEVGGWAESGLYANQYGQKNAYFPNNEGLDWNSGNTYNLRNVRQADFQLNQAWVYFGKKLNPCAGLDFGGRVDAVFGTDACFTQSDGLEYRSGTHREWRTGDYYTSLAQIYGEVGYGTISLKIGKFLSPVMGESIMSPNRFFYSLPLAFASTSVTNSGALATWRPNNEFSAYLGWVNGADKTFFSSDDNAMILGFDYQCAPNFRFGYTGMWGKDKERFSTDQYYMHSLYFNWQLSQRWNYTCRWQLRNDNQNSVFGLIDHYGSYGINDEFVYRLNNQWAFGARLEWWREYEFGHDADHFEMTLGANWTPCSWLTIRPELRYDKVDGVSPFNMTKGTAKDHQFSGGFSAMIEF